MDSPSPLALRWKERVKAVLGLPQESEPPTPSREIELSPSTFDHLAAQAPD